MPTIEHSALTGSELHEPKGAPSASSNQFYLSDGVGSGTWTYVPQGWGYYKDDTAAQVFTTTAALVTNDGAGTETVETYLPPEIRGSSSLWDTTNDYLDPIAIGDCYMIRLDLSVTATSGTPKVLTLEFDVGGGASPSDVRVTIASDLTKTAPYEISMCFSVTVDSTFNTNGGQIFLKTDTGTLTVDDPGISIVRVSSGAI